MQTNVLSLSAHPDLGGRLCLILASGNAVAAVVCASAATADAIVPDKEEASHAFVSEKNYTVSASPFLSLRRLRRKRSRRGRMLCINIAKSPDQAASLSLSIGPD